MNQFERRLAAAEVKAASRPEALRPWVRVIVQPGEPDPPPVEGANMIIRRIVVPKLVTEQEVRR